MLKILFLNKVIFPIAFKLVIAAYMDGHNLTHNLFGDFDMSLRVRLSKTIDMYLALKKPFNAAL